MTTPSLKWAVAAAALSSSVRIDRYLAQQRPAAYAFAQTVEAMQGKRSFTSRRTFSNAARMSSGRIRQTRDLVRFAEETNSPGPMITNGKGILNR